MNEYRTAAMMAAICENPGGADPSDPTLAVANKSVSDSTITGGDSSEPIF